MHSYAELHVHIEGTLEPEMAFALAKRNGIELPFASVDELRSRYQFNSLQDFLDLYYANMAVLTTEQDFADLANAYFARANQAGVVHAELSCDLQAHLDRGVPAEVVLGGLNAALSRSKADYGISSGLILSFLRHLPVEHAQDAYAQAVDTGVELLGVGLCSSEVGFPAAPFAGLFGRARADGLHTVAHAGEEAGPESIWECLRTLRVGRIDHGVRAVEDRELLYYLADYSIPLTVCPLSNVALKVVPSLAEHPLPELLAQDVVVTINSDDPAYFGGYLDANIAAITEAFDLTDEQLNRLARNSISASFLSAPRRRELLAEPISA